MSTIGKLTLKVPSEDACIYGTDFIGINQYYPILYPTISLCLNEKLALSLHEDGVTAVKNYGDEGWILRAVIRNDPNRFSRIRFEFPREYSIMGHHKSKVHYYHPALAELFDMVDIQSADLELDIFVTEINGQKVGKAYLNYMNAKVNLKDDGSRKVYLEWKEEKPEKLEKEKKIDYTERNAEIRRLRSGGMTLDAIAEKYGITRLRVSQIVGKEKKDTLGFSPEVYWPLQRGMIRQNGTDYENFTLKDLERAIEEGLPVQHIGETRVKEISDIFGREVTLTREYDAKMIRGLLYKSGSYVSILRFKREVKE